MRNWAGDILDTVENTISNKNFKGLKICAIKSTAPLILTYNGVDIGTKEGDTIYVHPLFISSPIEQDENLLIESQNFKSTTAYNSPEFQGIIEGTIPDFLKEFYLFYKNWQANYLLKAGDLVAVWEGVENSYLILQKIIIDVLQNERIESEF